MVLVERRFGAAGAPLHSGARAPLMRPPLKSRSRAASADLQEAGGGNTTPSVGVAGLGLRQGFNATRALDGQRCNPKRTPADAPRRLAHAHEGSEPNDPPELSQSRRLPYSTVQDLTRLAPETERHAADGGWSRLGAPGIQWQQLPPGSPGVASPSHKTRSCAEFGNGGAGARLGNWSRTGGCGMRLVCAGMLSSVCLCAPARAHLCG